MSERWLVLAIALVMVILAVGLGRRVLMANPYLLGKGGKILRFLASFIAGAAIFLAVGSFIYLPASSGESTTPGSEAEAHAQSEPKGPVVWIENDFSQALRRAQESGKPIVLDAWAAWCKPCKKLFSDILQNPRMAPLWDDFVLLRIDTEDPANQEAVKRYGISDDLPWVGFLDSKGVAEEEFTLFGEKGAEPFSNIEEFEKIVRKARERLLPPSPGDSWLIDLEEGFRLSKELNRPLLADAWATYCVSCLELKRQTFSDPKVKEALAGHVLVEMDMALPQNDWIWERYAIKGLPWVALFEPGESLEPRWVLQDFEPPEKFLARLESGGGESEGVTQWLASRGLALTLFLIFLAGVGASLTPCAFPVYIFTLGFFAGGGGEKRSGVLGMVLIALVMVLGMAVSYSLVGVAAALGGGAVGRIMSNPWVAGGFAVLFIVMGAFLLGILPSMEFAGLKGVLDRNKKRSPGWAFLYGLVMGLVVAPCVGPVLVGILAYIATTSDVVLGVSLMLAFALGMGALLFVMAVFFQTFKERFRMGSWSEAISVVFATIFFALALYYLKEVISPEPFFVALSL